MTDAASRVVESRDLRWSWTSDVPAVLVGRGRYPIEERVLPVPAYAHDREIVVQQMVRCERAFPIANRPHVYLLDRDNTTGFNGLTSYAWDYDTKDEHGRHGRLFHIVLFGKRIPIHPAVTRYLVAHEYGHVVEDIIALRRYTSQEPDLELLADYARLRGIEGPAYYGPGTWHASPGEVFANDFRILVVGSEPEYWPHPGIARPEDVPAVRDFWRTALDEQIELEWRSAA